MPEETTATPVERFGLGSSPGDRLKGPAIYTGFIGNSYIYIYIREYIYICKY